MEAPVLSSPGWRRGTASSEPEKRLEKSAPRRGAGAAPGEDAPGARQDVSLSESSPQAKQVGLGVGLAQGHMG